MDLEDSSIESLDAQFDLDELFPHIGEFGPYQKRLLWLMCLPACVPCGFVAFHQLFMAEVPQHWCAVPELARLQPEERRRLSIPLLEQNSTEWNPCYRFIRNWTTIPNLTDPDGSWPIEYCPQGWEYNKTDIYSSVVIDFDLVCNYSIYPTLGLVALNIGGPIGVYLFGWISDRFGRKISFFVCLTTLLIGNGLTAISINFWMWAASRLVVGLCVPALYQVLFVLALELVGPNYRALVTSLTCIAFTGAVMVLAGIVYLIRDWVHLTLVTSLPFIAYYLYWFCLPESPRWLLANGHFEEASSILEKLASVNQKTLPHRFKEQLKHKIINKLEHKENILDTFALCRTPNMRLKTGLITLNWFTNVMVYVGLSYFAPLLGSNQYISFLLSAVVELPAYMLCWMVIDKWGRRWPLTLCIIIAGVSCIIIVMLPPDSITLILVFYLISKSSISASYLILYSYAGELFPTEIRALGIGTISYVGGLGLIVLPFITYLGTEHFHLPFIILGVLSIIGGLTSLRLPETLHHRLPQTIEEGEAFGKDFTWEDCVRCIPLKPRTEYEGLELDEIQFDNSDTESTEVVTKRRSIKKLVTQSSMVDPQKDFDGTMKMTCWF